MGAFDCLAKPFLPKILLTYIEKALAAVSTAPRKNT